MIRRAIAILICALAFPLAADRIEFRALAGGKRLTGSSVCFFPAVKDDPFFLKFLSSNDVRCLDANAVIEIPPGYWNIFAVHPSGYVSTHPYFLAKGADGALDQYTATDLTMHRAAVLDLKNVAVSLGPSEWIAIYLTNDSSPSSPASIRPVADRAIEVSVPAGMTIVPLVVRSARIVRFGEPLKLSPGERRTVARFDSTNDVVALTVAEDETLEAHGTPEVTLLAGDQRIEPMLPVAAYPQFSRSLQFFRNVPAGEARLRLSGDGWIPDELLTNVRTGTTQAPRPLTTAPAATLEIAWSITSTATSEQLRAPTECAGEPFDESATVRIARCNGQDCNQVDEISLDGSSGSGELRITTLRPGSYRVELTYGSTRVRETVKVPSRVKLPLEIRVITGRVTRGGAPIAAEIGFPTGIGVSGADGRYTAVVARPPTVGVAYVTPCDGGARYTHRSDTPPSPTRDYDIDLPDNEIVVSVRDRTSNAPVPRARIVARLFAGDEELEALPFRTTDEAGRTILEDVSSREPLEICASTDEHEVACAPRFVAGGRRRVDLALARKVVRRGRVTGGSARFATLYWVSPRGMLKERSVVRPGGAFTFDHDPEPGEMLVYAGSDHPLTVVPVPPWSRGTHLDIDLPRTEVRSFEVSLSERNSEPRVRFTIAVGAFVVPPEAFADHQHLRASEARVERGTSMPVRDIAATAPLAVVYADILRIPVTAPRVEIP